MPMIADDDGDALQCIGDGKRAIEDLDCLRAQAAIGEDHQVMSGGNALHLRPQVLDIHARSGINREVRRITVGQVLQGPRAVDDDEAFLACRSRRRRR